ncbi:MAG: CHASE3 domain-containing protein [Caulobacteraceae bacterium]
MTKRLNPSPWLLAAGFLVLAALLAATLAVSAGQRRDNALVRHSLQVQNRLSTVLSRLQDAETGERGYALTGDPAFLQPYDDAVAKLDGDIDTLARLTADNPRQRAAIARLRPMVQARMDRLKASIAARRTGGLQTAASLVANGGGKAIMDALRAQIAAMRAEEDRLLAIREIQAAATADRLRTFLIFGFALVVVLTVVALRESATRLAEVSRSRDALALANAQLTAEAETRQKAEAQVRQMQKMEAVGQLTGGIAHDFNNMLSIVIGSLELARRRLGGEPARAEACIDNAIEGAQRAAGLTSRLLAFSRQQPLAPIVTDPNKLVGGMSELLRRTVGEQLRVETVRAGGVWRINIDPPQLENALLNLCVNARDAMPDGGNLTIETANAYLDDAYAAAHNEVTAGQYVLISVTDTGIGMAPEVVERAFDPFYTTKGVGRGTGLGLSQVYGFVKQSGGHVKIYSEVGRGSSVKIYLPRWAGDAPVTGDTETVRSLPVAAGPEIILVVEDEERVRHVTVDALRELGYTVIQADTGEQAIQTLRLQPRVDLLFTDIVMPGMSGRALAEHIAAERPDLKVLYTTGYTRNAVVHNGVLDAGVAFLQKPFTIEQLARKVRQVLDDGGANRPA